MRVRIKSKNMQFSNFSTFSFFLIFTFSIFSERNLNTRYTVFQLYNKMPIDYTNIGILMRLFIYTSMYTPALK